MEITSSCTRCDRVLSEPDIGPGRALQCAGCGLSRELHDEAFEDHALQACPVCGTRDLYIQKDFPHGLGLAILFAGFAISTVFWYYMMPVATFAVLLATVFLDWVLYHKVPDVTICYRCLSQVRGAGSNPDGRYKPFDLAVGERYRQERIRLEQLRSGGPR